MDYLGLLEPWSKISSRAFSGEREKAWLALLLAWVAGYADAFGFLVLDNIFTSHISGNSVAAAAFLGQQQWNEAAVHAFPILFFVVGFFIGAILETGASRLRIRRRFSIGLSLEAALLLAFLIVGKHTFEAKSPPDVAAEQFYSLVALLAGAMGVQSASLRHVGGHSVNTPYVTGMLAQSVEHAVVLLFNGYDRLRRRPPDADRVARDNFNGMIFHGALWLLFAIGAVCGGVGEQIGRYQSMVVPPTALIFIILCDLVRPVHG